MKKFYSLLVAAAMVMGATSCQKDVAETVATNEPVSFTATLNNTRTELGEGNKVMWNADDKITIYTQENTAGVVFDGDATEAAATATFTTTSEFTPSATGYFAVHPNTTNVASYADCVWSVPVSIADTQTPKANTYDEKSNFTVAYSTTNNLSFKPGTALLKFTYTGTQGYAYLHSYSATLYGSATLNYSTNDNTISYTNLSGSGSLYIENLTQGETYYVAIFPGTATDLALYDGSMYSYDMMSGSMSENIPIFKYSKEIAFEAGKVYTLNTKEPAVASPYKLISANMEQQFPMVIENGYHIAKGISYLDAGFCFFDGENALTATTDVVPGEWQATKNGWTEDYALIPFFTNCDQADIYLSEDASMMCVVPAGAEVPAMPVVSPWKLYLGDLSNTTMMFVENGFHVAKNINVSELGYFFFDEMNPLTATADVVLSKWQITKNAFDENYEPIPFFINSETAVDIYLSEDASMMCVVSAGEPMPTPFIPEVTAWSLVGAFNEWGAAGADIPFYTTRTANLYVAENVALDGYAEWKIRKDNAWTKTFGGGFKYTEPNRYVTVYDNGSNVSVTATGTYDIYFEYNGSGTTAKMYVVTAGSDYKTAAQQTTEGPKQSPDGVSFGIVGDHNSWGNDNVMTFDDTLNAYVAKEVALKGGFKIRGNKNWDSGYNFGSAGTSNVTIGKGITVQNSGSSGNLTVAAGTYDVYFSYGKDMVWVMNVGEVPTDL